MKNLTFKSCKKITSILLATILLLFTISGQVFAANPKISIIIPVYNTPENLLRACLNSAKNQTLKEIEIICVDDGSTNEIGKILDEYAENDPRFKVVHQENMGGAIARNKGLDLASGEYIQFLDSDDTIDQNMSEKCYNKAKKYNSDIVKCNCSSSLSWAELREHNKIIIGPIFYFYKQGFIWNGIWKRIFSNGDKLYFLVNSRRRHDEVLNLTFIPKANKVIFFSENLYNHTFQNNNSITKFFQEHQNDALECMSKNTKCIYENWKENGYFNDNVAKIYLLKFILHEVRTYQVKNATKNKYKLVINSIGPELLQDDVINLLPLKERMQLRNIIQAAKKG